MFLTHKYLRETGFAEFAFVSPDNVVLAAKKLDRLTATANEVREIGKSALAIPTDVTDAKQVEH